MLLLWIRLEKEDEDQNSHNRGKVSEDQSETDASRGVLKGSNQSALSTVVSVF